MKWCVVAIALSAVAARAQDLERPRLIASVHVTPFTSFPDLLSVSATVHAIPYIDVSGGVSGFTDRFGWWVRGGPRLQVGDWRDEQHRGLTWRISAQAGYRAFRDARANAAGFSGLVATDFAHFFSAHFAVSLQVALGGLYDAASKRVLPELRAGVGVTF